MKKRRVVNVGLIGSGTIGTGVIRLLRKGLGKRNDVEIKLEKVVDKK